MSIIAWGTCNTLGDILEDSEAREAALLRRRFLNAVVFLTRDIYESADKRRSGLEADDISDLIGWHGDQVLLLAWQTFFSSLVFLLWFRWEKTVADLTWLDFC